MHSLLQRHVNLQFLRFECRLYLSPIRIHSANASESHDPLADTVKYGSSHLLARVDTFTDLRFRLFITPKGNCFSSSLNLVSVHDLSLPSNSLITSFWVEPRQLVQHGGANEVNAEKWEVYKFYWVSKFSEISLLRFGAQKSYEKTEQIHKTIK